MPRFIYPPYYMSPNVDFNAGYSLYGVRRYETQRASQEGKHPPKAYIEEFCAKIRKGLDKADFNVKRQIIQLFDIRGKIAFENGERVLYLKCLIEPREPQAVSRVLTSHWRCNLKGTHYLVTARLVLPKSGYLR